MLSWSTKFQATTRYLGLIVLVVGCVVLVGWIFNVTAFKRILPGLVEMKANTALGFMAAGTAVFMIATRRFYKEPYDVPRVLSVFVLVLGLLTLMEHLLGVNLGI